MIQVGFANIINNKWVAGQNYFKNLFFAVSRLSEEERKIALNLFIGSNYDDPYLETIKDTVRIVKTDLLNYDSKFDKITRSLCGRSRKLEKVLIDNGITVSSHTGLFGKKLPFKTLNWIPDFQHVCLPDMFPLYIRKKRDWQFSHMLEKSDCVIVSSKSSLNDLNKFSKGKGRAEVLQFVSQPEIINEISYNDNKEDYLDKTYNISGKYFFLPNQFWKHKNHKIVFKAIKEAKKIDKSIKLICSGSLDDYRNKTHIESIKNYIIDNDLEDNIILLGFIKYSDVLLLIKNAISVINPSLFEGWSTTVEECKSIGKKVILSNIPVHVEQNPPNAFYFDPSDYLKLSQILIDVWNKNNNCDEYEENEAIQLLKKRTHEFALNYQNIILSLFS